MHYLCRSRGREHENVRTGDILRGTERTMDRGRGQPRVRSELLWHETQGAVGLEAHQGGTEDGGRQGGGAGQRALGTDLAQVT